MHGKDAYSSSEASSDEWQSGDSNLDDSHVAKRSKLASSTKDSNLQQVSSNSEVSRTHGTITADNRSLGKVSSLEETTSEETTSSSCSEDEAESGEAESGDGEWVDRSLNMDITI